jgi:hypothetical protein
VHVVEDGPVGVAGQKGGRDEAHDARDRQEGSAAGIARLRRRRSGRLVRRRRARGLPTARAIEDPGAGRCHQGLVGDLFFS